MIDTIQVARDLTAGSSISQQDAEAIVQTIAKMQTAELATKIDIADLRTEIVKVKTDLIYWFVGAFLLNAVVQIVVGLRH